MEGHTLLRYIVLALEVGLTAGLIFWMRNSTRGVPISWKHIFTVLAAGGGVALIAALVTIRYSFNIPLLQDTQPTLIEDYKGWLIFLNVMSAGAVEELAKYTVGVFFLVSNRKVKRLSDIIASMIMVGLGFSLIEDILYLMTTDAVPTYRLLSFYLHSGTSAIMGYALGRFHFGLAGYRELIKALATAIGLHCVYNLSLNLEGTTLPLYLALTVTLYISLQIFILFRKTLEEEYDMNLKIERKKPRVTTKLLNL
jgi:RsiW-degrading membrane proteinase PrsW (M82 family)